MDVSLLLLVLPLWFLQGTSEIVYPDEEEPTLSATPFSYFELAKDVLTEIDIINKKLKDVVGGKVKDYKGIGNDVVKAAEKEVEDVVNKLNVEELMPKSSENQYRNFDIKSCDCKCKCADTVSSNYESKTSSLRNTLQAAGKMIKNKLHGMTS